MKKTTLTAILTLGYFYLFSQNVAINSTGTAPNASAMLDVQSNNKGILIPRVALTGTNDATTVPSPANWLMVFNTNTAGTGTTAVSPGTYYWDGSKWVRLVGSEDAFAWKITGNNDATSGTHFLGTTNAQALDFRTNNTIRFRVANANQVHAMALGTAALPFYSWSADPNTGIFSPGADQIDFSTGGTARFRIPAANQVHALSLGTAALPFYSWSADPNTGIFSPAADQVGITVGGNQRVWVTNLGTQGAIGFQGAPTASSYNGQVYNNIFHPTEFGNDAGLGYQGSLGLYFGNDVAVLSETDSYGYVGYSGLAWWRMYSYGYVNPSDKNLKRDFTAINGNHPVESYVMKSIDKIQPYFYKYIDEEDVLNEDNYTKYRPMMRLGTLLQDSPDYLQDEGFSGIDIYALATLGIVGVKANRKEIQSIKNSLTVSDFGTVSNVSNGQVEIKFTDDFVKKCNGAIPTISLSVNSFDVQAIVTNKTATGFVVKVRTIGNSSDEILVDWIAVGTVANNTESNEEEIPASLREKLEISDEVKEKMKKLHSQPATDKARGVE